MIFDLKGTGEMAKTNKEWNNDYIEMSIFRKKTDGKNWSKKRNVTVAYETLEAMRMELKELGYKKNKMTIDDLMEFYYLEKDGYIYRVVLSCQSFGTTPHLDIKIVTENK